MVLGTIGGIGLIFGPLGLMIAKLRRDPVMVDEQRLGMDFAFLAMLFLTSLTGLLLLVLRATPAMPLLLALHLGVVFALFITMPYGKFVHGIYRFAALVRYAREHRAFVSESGKWMFRSGMSDRPRGGACLPPSSTATSSRTCSARRKCGRCSPTTTCSNATSRPRSRSRSRRDAPA